MDDKTKEEIALFRIAVLFRLALQARNRPEFGAGFEFERTKAAPSVLPEAA